MYNIKRSTTLEAIDMGENGLLTPQTLISIKLDKPEISTGTLTGGVAGRGVFRKKKGKMNKSKRKTKGCGCK